MSALDALLDSLRQLPEAQQRPLRQAWSALQEGATQKGPTPERDLGDALLGWGLLHPGSFQSMRHWPHALLQGEPSPLRAAMLLRFMEGCYPSPTSFYREDYQGIALEAFRALRGAMPQALQGFDSFSRRENREELLLFLCATLDPKDNQGFLLKLAQDPTAAPVRRAALDSLLRGPESCTRAVAQLLESSQLSLRLDVAQALGRAPQDWLRPALERALARERVERVFAALASALDACARCSGDAAAPSLASLAWKAAPKLLQKKPAPPLRLADGAAAPEEEQRGLLTLLRAEDEHQHNPHVRAHLARFLRQDIEALGEHLYQVWSAEGDRKPERAWGLYQLTHTASAPYLLSLGKAARQMLGTPQEFQARLLILGRHGSALGRQLLAWALEHRISKLADHAQEGARQISPLLLAPGGPERAAGRYLSHNSDAIYLIQRALLGFFEDGTLERAQMARHQALPYQAELAHQDLYTPGQDSDGLTWMELAQHQVALRLVCLEPPTLGALTPQLQAEYSSIAPPVESRELERALGQARDSSAARSSEDLAGARKALEDAAPGNCWTWPTWRRLTWRSAAHRLMLRGWLFTQAPGRGPVFGLNADFEPSDERDQPVQVDPMGLIHQVDPGALPQAQRQRWQQQLERWHQQRLQRRSPPVRLSIDSFDLNAQLQDLRALLYEEPSPRLWARLVQALDRWSDAQSLPMAVDYLRQPILQGWGELARPVPRQWLRDPEHSDIPLRCAPGHDPRLALCDAWTWEFAQDRSYQTWTWAAQGPLASLSSLELVGPRGRWGRQLTMDQATLARVLNLPCWQQLRRLTLTLRLPRRHPSPTPAYQAFGQLQQLWLYGTENNARALARWLADGALPRLEEITLHRGKGAEALAVLVEEADLTSIKKLRYTPRAGSDARLWEALLANPTARHLTALETNAQEPPPDALRARVLASRLSAGVQAALLDGGP